MQKVRYTGTADQQVLSGEDMLQLGVEDHPGLWWNTASPVAEVEDDVAEILVTKMKDRFKLEPTDEEVAAEMVDLRSREELLAEAEGLELTGLSKATKEELALAIVEEQARRAAAETQSETVPSANEGEAPNPSA